MFPTSMRPVLMPMRIRSGVPQRTAAARCKASRGWHSSAAAQALAACRSLGAGAPQNAITPSPMNLSIVPQWLRTALDTASRYSARTGTTRSPSRIGDAGEAGDIREHYRQRLLVPAGASLDALGNQRADELGRHVLLERCQPSAHLQEDARKVVELAQRRGEPDDPIEAEAFEVFELAADAL